MAIFSRRTLQRLIYENASFLTKKQLENHTNKLNKGDLSAEWEVVLLNVFAKIGPIEHEKIFNRKTPDIYFNLEKEKIEFIADITTLSDKDLNRKNPIDYLYEKLRQIKTSKKIKGSFGIEVEADVNDVINKDLKRRIYLPTMADFEKEIFSNVSFKDFIIEVIKKPEQFQTLNLKKDNYILSAGEKSRIDFKINYYPVGPTITTHLSYKLVTSIKKNTVWNALTEKYKKLKSTNYIGEIGIILCDGGCEKIREKITTSGSKKLDEIVVAFLEEKPNVSFVLVFSVDDDSRQKDEKEIRLRLFEGHALSANLKQLLHVFGNNINSLFPRVENTVIRAISLLDFLRRSGLVMGNKLGYTSSSHNSIKMSARSLLDLMTGRMSQEIFIQNYGTFIKGMADRNQLITNITISRLEDVDDDEIVFTFGQSDPAVALFKIPDKNN